MSSPLRQNDLDQLDDQIEETDQSESTSNSEELCRRIYDLIVEDQRDELQQLIYDHQIHINEVFWKNDLTPLHIAAMKGHLLTTQMLIINEQDPNAVDKIGRTPLHWAARNRHNEVYNFLKPLTNDGSRVDIYGISADSFYPDDESTVGTPSGNLTTPLSPLSLSSLTLHTISLSTAGNSPTERYPLSPRALDVSLRPQFCSPSKDVVFSRHQSSIPLVPASQRSPFLVEDKSLTDCTEVEWEPLDERIPFHSRSLGSVDEETKMMISSQQHSSSLTLPDFEDQMSESELTANSSENLHSLPKGANSKACYRPLPPLTIDTSQHKSKKFYSLRRKISMMLFNVQDEERGQEQEDEDKDDDNDSQHTEKKKKSYLKKLFSDSSTKKKMLTSHTHSLNPLNGGSSTALGTAAAVGGGDDESVDGCRMDPKLNEFHTPMSQSTTLSTNSDDQLPVKASWMSWRRVEKNKRGSKKNHHRSSSETSVESTEMLSNLQPFRNQE